MRVDIGDGTRIWFDVDGSGLVPDDATMVERPTLVLLHGGPGMDHSGYKPAFTALTDICQVVYYDHRGQGRSDRSDPALWTLDTWADDVVRFCDALGIERPIVLGNSFGGMVAMRYLARHRDHPAKVVLSSTAATSDFPTILDMFERLGGTEARDAAESFWLAPDRAAAGAALGRYLSVCGPLYTQVPGNIFETGRAVVRGEVLTHFLFGEQRDMDLLPGLSQAVCPVLVLAGELDPVCPVLGSERIVAALPESVVRFERFADAGHGVFRDQPDRAFQVLRDFITN
jgi:pimeloyl-ACP methyl ester carboxylesterase